MQVLTARANAVAMGGSGNAVTVRIVANLTQPVSAQHREWGTPMQRVSAAAAGHLKAKAILAFQRVAGADALILGLYLHEYGPAASPVYAGRIMVECVDSPPVWPGTASATERQARPPALRAACGMLQAKSGANRAASRPVSRPVSRVGVRARRAVSGERAVSGGTSGQWGKRGQSQDGGRRRSRAAACPPFPCASALTGGLGRAGHRVCHPARLHGRGGQARLQVHPHARPPSAGRFSSAPRSRVAESRPSRSRGRTCRSSRCTSPGRRGAPAARPGRLLPRTPHGAPRAAACWDSRGGGGWGMGGAGPEQVHLCAAVSGAAAAGDDAPHELVCPPPQPGAPPPSAAPGDGA